VVAGRTRDDDPERRKAHLQAESYLALDVYFRQAYEPETTAFVRRWLRPGDTFLDVGANVGYYTCLAASLTRSPGSVHAFEPNPEVTPWLQASIQLNRFDDRVTFAGVAVGSEDKACVDLFTPHDPEDIGRASLLHMSHLEGRTYRVLQVTLDSYAAAHGIESVRLLKLDIEGGELAALRGARRLMTDVRPEAIVCEVQPSEASPNAVEELCQAFRDFGYVPHAIEAGGSLKAVEERSLGRVGVNLCFTPGS
jgi:FkbM family methyltransferase